MAAEMPVKDVLCEAMEYLSKLGANLRIRSENLKEKKIRKDKLTNSLAVQKAADKVLLICELSKKSLSNVEAGVRKVLDHIDNSQASSNIGGKNTNVRNKRRDFSRKYNYFDYKSRKLKIKNNISIKHYKSVKVHVKKMSLAILNNYPVYYDCKLYRMRNRENSRTSDENTKCLQKEPENGQGTDKNLEQDNGDADTIKTRPKKRSSAKNFRRDSKSNDDSDQEKLCLHLDSSTENKNDCTNKTRIRKNSGNMASDDEPEKKKISKTNIMQQNKENADVSDNEQQISSGSKDNEDDSDTDSKKPPIIKCVSLSKLLKPDVLQKNSTSQNPKKNIGKKLEFNINKKNEMLLAAKKKTNEFWAQKRKEVSAFKSKKFVINIIRLPNLDVKFMIENKLKKITSRGNTICKINGGNSDSIVEELPKKLNEEHLKQSFDTSGLNDVSDDEQLIAIANKVKNSLLNESDSDDDIPISEEKSETTVDRVKQALLHSDSDQNEGTSDEIFMKQGDDKTKEKKNSCSGDEERLSDKNTQSDGDNDKDNGNKDAKKDLLRSESLIQSEKADKSCDEDNGLETNNSERSESLIQSEKADKSCDEDNGMEINNSEGSESLIQSEKADKSCDEDNGLETNNSERSESLVQSEKADKSCDEDNGMEINNSEGSESLIQSEKADKSCDEDNRLELNNSERSESLLQCEKADKSCDEDNGLEINNSEGSESPIQSEKGGKSCDEDNGSEINNSRIDNVVPDLLRGQQTPDKELPVSNINSPKNSISNSSSEDTTKIPLDQRKTTPQSKKKSIRESVHAKNALLRYSSSSETEDEQLRNTLNEIKQSLLEGMSDDEETKLKANKLAAQRESSIQSSSSSEVEMRKTKKKKISSSSKERAKKRKRCITSDSEEEKKNNSSSEEPKSSRSSSRKMVRSKSKPGNSSGHSSDAQDPIDKDIDGLTNLRTLNKTRRRDSNNTDQSEISNSTSTRSRMATKPTGLISEDVILKAESSSDDATNDEDNADDEELPPVTLPGFNGGLEHLARDDLLGESDSSVSNKEEIKEDSDEEHRLNAKRKKANLIASSDSETGTGRKEAQGDSNRVSDFDDSDDSELTKRSKRKKKGSDSDASAGSSDAGKKKRRRIKQVDDDSDASGSDSENEGKNKHGRKNIRKVMGKNQLEEATKKAAREEKERVARIAERQKMYNNLQFDESGKPDEVVLDKVVLDFDPETKEPLIAVDRGLVKKLKPHQANGIKFMWDACFESVKRIKKDKGSGCILAHCMGLGKTLQVVALTHTLLAHNSLTKVHRVLVVCPLSTVLNWVSELKMWLKFAERENDIDVYELSRFKQNSERAFQLSQWFEHGGVCVLGYEMFRNLSADNNKKFKKKMLKNFQEALVEPGPDLVVCDEGHLLKNEKTSLSQSMNKVRTLRRIVLTGTPLQNNLKEYYCMVQFVKPNLLGKYNEYLNRFVNPITNGQYTDSTDHDIKIMKRRSHVLHKMLDGAVQRRDYGVLAPFLPPKHEYVLFITLTEVQVKLYQFYLDNYSRRPLPGKSSGFLFPDFQSLQRIWTHPLVLKYNSERYEIMQQKKRDKEEDDSEGSLVDFIDDESTPDESSSADSTDDSSELSDDSRKKSKKKKSSKKSKGKDKDKDKDKESTAAARRRGTRANPSLYTNIDLDLEDEKSDDILEVKNENPTEWWIKMVEEDVLEDLRNSHKLVLLFDILRQCETIGDKLLVFSQSLYSLDLIEHFLGKVDEATQDGRIDEKLGNHVGSWSPGVDYFRLDGSTSCENRSIWCKNFNREDNPRARLFLISTRAGGLGINLVAANRVVIFDVSWNPSHDVQSIFRVYRFGQKKPCYVYRFLAMGTMEEKIYERQVTKQAISKRVIDEQQIDRHYAENDLAELYKFEAEPPSPRPLPPLPKDRLFAELLREHEAQIYKYHEHDSLLENKEEETLSEEERKAAWEDFENEKNKPPPAPFPAPWPMHNGMVPNLLAHQQQLAYAAMAAMLRKDMPNINDNQIRDMLPMIYNANPAMFGGYDYGLMQKMSDIYKYSQQMNMTPGMMAQGSMNPAVGSGGMASMGSGGLQYEPPWQRQQHQQQQMRLQQLLAQQQSMGAASKYYAGGLGSRDPVAMALQQQRAREIMVGGGAGRPRGRPPLQPRGPPAPSADVVNLDSD